MARSFEHTFDVDAPPSQVWFVSTDVERMPEWSTSMTKVVLEPKGPLAVGSTARITQPKLSTASPVSLPVAYSRSTPRARA